MGWRLNLSGIFKIAQYFFTSGCTNYAFATHEI